MKNRFVLRKEAQKPARHTAAMHGASGRGDLSRCVEERIGASSFGSHGSLPPISLAIESSYRAAIGLE
jgi:hypothetical protein